MGKSSPAREGFLNTAVAYAGSVDRLWAWQRDAKLTDKDLALIAGVSVGTLKERRQNRRLLSIETMYRLRARLGDVWFQYVIDPPTTRDDFRAELASVRQSIEALERKLSERSA